MKYRHSTTWLILLASLIAAPGACTHPPEQAGRPPTPVTAAAAVARNVPVYLDEIGTTQASEVVNIQSQVTGQIMERHFNDGEDLKKGQVLFVIDQRMFQAKVSEARANLEQKNSQLEIAQNQFDLETRAAKQGAASAEDINTKKGALDIAKAQVKVNQAALDTALLNLSYCTITSPLDGRAGQRLVDAGNIVTANGTSLLTIERLTPIYVDFTITERDLPDVRDLMNKGALHAGVSIPQRANDPRQGEITFLDNTVQPAAGRVRLRATMANADRFFWPGQFVNVRLILRTLPNALLVPYQCVQIGQQGPYVYVISPQGDATMHAVTLGQRQGDMIVVENGVAAGDEVIQTGQLAVTPGGKVRIVASAATAPTTSTGTAGVRERP